jgi:hypothetical protein
MYFAAIYSPIIERSTSYDDYLDVLSQVNFLRRFNFGMHLYGNYHFFLKFGQAQGSGDLIIDCGIFF